MHGTDPLEHFRRQMLAGAQAYDAHLAADLTVYRRQRAWRVMLACRKLYSLAVRGGWAGRWRAARWALRGLFGGSLDLETEELQFPDLTSYLPEELFRSNAKDAGAGPAGVSRFAGRRQADILVFPVFNHDFRFQRPQQIAAELSRRGHRVFWASPSRVVGSGQAYAAVPLGGNLWELQLRMRPQDLYQGTLTKGDLDAMMESLEAFCRDFALASSCALVQFPYWRKCALALRERFGATLVYDCMDDWQSWSAKPAIGSFAQAEERSLARECDLLLVTSRRLEERYRGEGLSPLLVRNAADFRFFAEGGAADLLAEIPRPIIGYFGAIAEWFDLELVREVARARPQYSFVLIGHSSHSDIGRLRQLPNVFLLGEKRYRDLPSYLQSFDVCLIPFVINSITHAADPVKVYEYFSQGKPVIAVPLPELAEMRELVYFAERPAEFGEQIDNALAESGGTLRARRTEFAAGNTWAHRVDQVTTALKARCPLVSILMVTYNCRDFLRPCLDSIFRNTAYPNYELVVVDNNSKDGTLEVLREYAAGQPLIRLEPLEENRGFAGGNNEAARLSRGDYLLLLNPDTIVTFGWLHRLLRVLHNYPGAGVVVPVTNFSGNETKINVSYSDLEGMEEFAHFVAARRMGIAFEVPVAPLFCGLIARSLWQSLGGLDERYRVGMFEDDDLSLRVQQANLKVMAAEDCFVHHFGSGSFAALPTDEWNRIFEENRRRFEEKWKRPWNGHRYRRGVSSQPARRFAPAAFVAGQSVPVADGFPTPVLRKLSPAVARVGAAPGGPQGGSAAIVIDCTHATPGTVAMFDGQTLETEFASASRLTALVPAKLLARQGRFDVWLENDHGTSNRSEFVIG
jgi:GT2 family glycosyltransferase/glycosyltransferase involved in cell wall biosynthesis